jgi:hypothetical protein
MSEYDWRKYWRDVDKSGDKIKCVTPFRDGFIVEYSHLPGYIYLVDKDGKSATCAVNVIPIPAPPAHWAKESDVPEEAEWLKSDDFEGPRRICGVDSQGIRTIARHDSWSFLRLSNSRWSATRCGVYRDCVVVKEGGE